MVSESLAAEAVVDAAARPGDHAAPSWPGICPTFTLAGGPRGVLECLSERFVRLLAALFDARDAVLDRLPDRTVLLALELRFQVDRGFAEDLSGRGVVEERVLEVLDARVLHRRDCRREVS